MRIVGIRRGQRRPVEVAALSDDGTQVTVLAGARGVLGRRGRVPVRRRRPARRWPAADVEFVPPVLPGRPGDLHRAELPQARRRGQLRGDQALPEYPTLFARWTAVADRRRRRGAGARQRGRPGLGGRDRRLRRPDAGRRHPGRGAGRRRRLLDLQRPHLPPGAEAHHPVDPGQERRQLRPARPDGARPPRSATCATGCGCRPGSTARPCRTARTDEMVYTVGDTLSLISHTFTLRPGDLLATGTPSGVGYARTPPWLLQPGRRRRGRGRAARRAAQHRRRQRHPPRRSADREADHDRRIPPVPVPARPSPAGRGPRPGRLRLPRARPAPRAPSPATWSRAGPRCTWQRVPRHHRGRHAARRPVPRSSRPEPGEEAPVAAMVAAAEDLLAALDDAEPGQDLPTRWTRWSGRPGPTRSSCSSTPGCGWSSSRPRCAKGAGAGAGLAEPRGLRAGARHDADQRIPRRGRRPANRCSTSSATTSPSTANPTCAPRGAGSCYGHHCAVNCLVVEGRMVLSPVFLGAEPDEIDAGPHAGLRRRSPSGSSSGIALMAALPDDQRRRATRLRADGRPGHAARAGCTPATSGTWPARSRTTGSSRSRASASRDMPAAAQQLVLAIAETVRPATAGGAARGPAAGDPRAPGRDLVLAGSAATQPGDVFYYRLQSPVIIAELDHHCGVFLDYDTPQPFHVHTVLRTPHGNDYGRAWVRQWQQARRS